jgi:hypothetical protein
MTLDCLQRPEEVMEVVCACGITFEPLPYTDPDEPLCDECSEEVEALWAS